MSDQIVVPIAKQSRVSEIRAQLKALESELERLESPEPVVLENMTIKTTKDGELSQFLEAVLANPSPKVYEFLKRVTAEDSIYIDVEAAKGSNPNGVKITVSMGNTCINFTTVLTDGRTFQDVLKSVKNPPKRVHPHDPIAEIRTASDNSEIEIELRFE